jgi:hypothetical protein
MEHERLDFLQELVMERVPTGKEVAASNDHINERRREETPISKKSPETMKLGEADQVPKKRRSSRSAKPKQEKQQQQTNHSKSFTFHKMWSPKTSKSLEPAWAEVENSTCMPHGDSEEKNPEEGDGKQQEGDIIIIEHASNESSTNPSTMERQVCILIDDETIHENKSDSNNTDSLDSSG